MSIRTWLLARFLEGAPAPSSASSTIVAFPALTDVEPIALAACRFPRAPDPEAFWRFSAELLDDLRCPSRRGDIVLA